MKTLNKDYEAFMGLEGPGGNIMRVMHPIEQCHAVRRAHLAVRKELRSHSAEGEEPMEVGTVTNSENSIDLNGTIFDIFTPMKKALAKHKGETINLRIHSPGGAAFEGAAIYNLLREDGRPVTTTAMGIAASTASVIFMAGDQRIVGQGAMLMIHDVWSCAIGNAEELRQLADGLDVASDAIAEIYAARAGGEVSEWRDRMAVNTFLGGDESVKMGLATGRETPVAKPKAKDKPKDDNADAEPVQAKPKPKKSNYIVGIGGGLIRTT